MMGDPASAFEIKLPREINPSHFYYPTLVAPKSPFTHIPARGYLAFDNAPNPEAIGRKLREFGAAIGGGGLVPGEEAGEKGVGALGGGRRQAGDGM